ncbi:MAG: hypothetical protein ACOYKD_08545 [Anaerolineaceae bacterium]|jgi:hypothetical protein
MHIETANLSHAHQSAPSAVALLLRQEGQLHREPILLAPENTASLERLMDLPLQAESALHAVRMGEEAVLAHVAKPSSDALLVLAFPLLTRLRTIETEAQSCLNALQKLPLPTNQSASDFRAHSDEILQDDFIDLFRNLSSSGLSAAQTQASTLDEDTQPVIVQSALPAHEKATSVSASPAWVQVF